MKRVGLVLREGLVGGVSRDQTEIPCAWAPVLVEPDLDPREAFDLPVHGPELVGHGFGVVPSGLLHLEEDDVGDHGRVGYRKKRTGGSGP